MLLSNISSLFFFFCAYRSSNFHQATKIKPKENKIDYILSFRWYTPYTDGHWFLKYLNS